ncbi:MAG TPA: hypothetical protein VE359_16990 [Vicinamibacteria bacterium]|nr:hypothetical protein [Vicinamibacteria bacterium]
MRKIIVSVPDQVYRWARMRAAARDTSVSALVREFLASVRRFRAVGRLKRDEAHDRDALR